MSHSITPGITPGIAPGITPGRRVRHDVRDSIAVMVFSAIASSGVAMLLALMVRIGN